MGITSDQADSTNYANAAISATILLTRLIVGRVRGRRIDLSFCLVALSIALLIARVTVMSFYISMGTVAAAVHRGDEYWKTHTLADVEIGTKMWLAGRVFITSILWIQIALLLLFYSKILTGTLWARYLIIFTWIAIASTYIATFLAGFLECQPFQLWWQVAPYPGSCIEGYTQLMCQCVSNMFLDVLLLILAFPILRVHGRSWSQHVRVGILYVLGTFCIVITIIRLTQTVVKNGSSDARLFWAAVQIIVSTFVANAPTIYGDFQTVRSTRRASRQRSGSRPEGWGSLASRTSPQSTTNEPDQGTPDEEGADKATEV